MRFVTFDTGEERRTGALVDGGVLDLGDASPTSGTALIDLLREDPGTPAAAVENALGTAATYRIEDVRLLPPLVRPNSLRDFSLVEEHLLNSIAQIAAGAVPGETKMALPELPREWYEIPAYYKGNPDEVYGPDDTIPWPAYTDRLDFELEIAVVIGRRGRRIKAEDAADHIFGYSILNDWSARDIQQREMRVNLGPGICKDFAYALGPCIVTPDEFDRDTAALEVRVDGEVWSTSRLKMQFSFEEVIAWISQEQTLHPGDVLASGTVVRGAGLELGRWVAEGSVVELDAEGIGVLRNQVGAKGAEVPLPPSQRDA